MKKQYYLSLITSIILLSFIVSCSKDFIEVKPEGRPLESTYYKNEAEATAGLVAVYDVLRKYTGGFNNMLALSNSASDDHVAGGGGASDGFQFQVLTNFTVDGENMEISFWSDFFKGVYRANLLLQKIPEVNMSQNLKDRFTAESRALRALYYFELVRMFKNVPLFTEPVLPASMYDVTQANPADVYSSIENDLIAAINVLPGTVSDAEKGRFTKGAAQALLGKVYLYQGKNSQAATVLAVVNGTVGGNNQYGNHLLSNYNDLWVVSNKFNAESLLEASHASTSGAHWWNWGSDADEGNSYNVMVGPREFVRNNTSVPDLKSGWSFNVITQGLYDVMNGDPRFGATILDVKALKIAGLANYTPGYMDTGYFLNKYCPRVSDVSTGPGATELNYRQNTYVIRLADTYLMEAEALGATGTRAQALLDAVRARVGLSSVPVSLQAIKLERRKEFAGEGHRFFDLIRWGDASAALGSRGFVAGKNEIMPIPRKELDNTLLRQNPGY